MSDRDAEKQKTKHPPHAAPSEGLHEVDEKVQEEAAKERSESGGYD